MYTELTILTLPFDPTIEGFAAERLRDYVHGREVISVQAAHFVQCGRPWWSVFLHTRRLQGAAAAVDVGTIGGAAAGGAPSDAQRAAFRELLGELSEHERSLYDRLRGWRRDVAHAEGKQHFMVASNEALLEATRRRPTTKAGLLEIRGIGEKKVAAYGDALLEVLHGRAGSTRRAEAADRAAMAGFDGVAAGDDRGLPEEVAPQPREPDGRGGVGCPRLK